MMATVLKTETAVPSRDELVARARALGPRLRERADAAEAARNLPAETIRDYTEAGFFRILQPRRWGGYEMHPSVFFDVLMTLAEYDMSSAWVYGVVGCHPYELALFHDQAQQEVWGRDTEVLVSSSYQPVGKVERVEGGFRLSGRWGFSSGSAHCQWVLLGALVPPVEPGGPPDMRTFLVPRSDYRIDDTWHVFGLKATGSNDVVVENAFVPDYRTHRAVDGFLCANPGQEENSAPLFSLPWAQIFVRSVSSAAIGAARGAIGAFLEIAKSRISTNTGKQSKSDPFALAAAAKAYAQVDEMETTLHRNFDRLMHYAEAGAAIPPEERLLYRYQSSTVVRRCAGLVDDLMPLMGGRAIYLSSPLVRYWLDLNAGRAHVANDPNFAAPDLANALMGEPVNPGFY
jgi:3-hydroxy-9,10-secoandrosta-1,3,5(10)-triene-9,17-dione monooxygenase